MSPDPRTLAADPEWLPHTYDVEGRNLTFVHVPRARHGELMFLSDDHYDASCAKATMDAGAVAAAAGEAAGRAPLHFIFHTAFCCSTLLVKAFDIPGRSAGLKEPDVLIHLANRLARSDDSANRRRLELVLRLLARPFVPGETMVLKPSNFANRIAVPALELLPDARAVLLWSDLPTLLHSLVKRGLWGRIWARRLFAGIRAWSPVEFGFEPAETFEQTDLQIAGLAWLMQICHFRDLARRFGPRVTILSGEDFLAGKESALVGTAASFGIPLDRDEAAAIAAGPLFSRHSKLAQLDYDDSRRASERAETAEAYRDEIEKVTVWIEAVARHLGLPLTPRGDAAAGAAGG